MLYPTNLLFTEGSLKMLMSSYVETIWSEKFSPSLDGFVKYCLENSNPLVTSLFLSVYYFMMPSLVKRLGLRLHRTDIADAASALGRHITNFYIFMNFSCVVNSKALFHFTFRIQASSDYTK